MMICEVSGCPADACEEVKEIVNHISKRPGGEGAVRDLVEWIIKETIYN